MDWYDLVFEMIDMRSFSNLWYWISVAVVWSTASHWVLGVPFDMVQRSARHGGQATVDLADMVRINVNRILYVAKYAGTGLLAFAAGLLTMLGLLGFVYEVEFAQAVFLLAFPMTIVILLNLLTARRIRAEEPKGAVLHRRMATHRLITQGVGVLSIFVTALWGAFHNLQGMGPLGG